MDNEGQNKNPGESSGAQGIFSTPELTVDTEKIAQNSDNSASDKSRVASIFANTDAGQRAQKLNNAMNIPEAEETGDLVIGNGAPKKNSKLPIIMAVVVLVMVVVGLVAFFVSKAAQPSNSETPQTVGEAFDKYIALLQHGPEELREENTGNKWFLLNLNSMDLTNTEHNNYLADLRKSFTDYETLVNASDSNAGLKEFLADYRVSLNLVINSLDLNVLADEVLKKYITEGEQSANAYVESVTGGNNSDPAGLNATINDTIRQFLSDQVLIVKIYDRAGCLVDNKIDYACSLEEGDKNTTLAGLQQSQNNAQMVVEYNFGALSSVLRSGTTTIKNLMEQRNE